MTAEAVVVPWLQAIYPPFRKAAGFAPWFLPEDQVGALLEETGDEGMGRLGGSVVAVAKAIEHLKPFSNPSLIDQDMCERELKSQSSVAEMGAALGALLGAWEKLRALWRCKGLVVDPVLVCQTLAVLFMAPVVPAGRKLTGALASALNSPSARASDLIDKYVECLARGKTLVMESVGRCIQEDKEWRHWEETLLTFAQVSSFVPRVIAVRPGPSSVVTDGLAAMIQERQ